MDEKLINEIYKNISHRSTEELLEIWTKNNRKLFSNEAFAAISQLISERGYKLPEQQASLLSSPSDMPEDYLSYAGFWKRFAAYFVDGIIISIVYGIAFFFLIFPMLVQGNIDPLRLSMINIGFSLMSTIFSWLYFALMESSSHQATLGKILLGMRVCDLEGHPISFARATGRFFGKILSGLILYIGFFMAAFTEKKQGLHDIMASCLVVDN
jgi:uncharacterized RDD family membrane protein YckC